jgi:hypothetical protein
MVDMETIRFTVDVDHRAYFAFGYGSKMKGADMVIFNDYESGSVWKEGITDTKASGHSIPKTDSS